MTMMTMATRIMTTTRKTTTEEPSTRGGHAQRRAVSDCEQRRDQQFRLVATKHFDAHGERQVADAVAAETIAPTLAGRERARLV
jgi:hypothetical protein